MTDQITFGIIWTLVVLVVWLCGFAGGWSARGERQRQMARRRTRV